MSNDTETTVLMRNAFYRDHYRQITVTLLILFFVNILLTIPIVEHVLNPPKPQYFPTNTQYQLIKYHPLSDPMVSDNFVKQWVADAIQQAFSLDFVHWRDQLKQASTNFTPSGWHWFLSAFQKSGDLNSLVKLSMVANATITGAPVIQQHSVLNGRYVWKIEFPMLITYQNLEKTIRVPLRVTVIVQRVSVQDNPNQIAISQFLPVVQSQ